MKEYLPYVALIISIVTSFFTIYKYIHSQRIAQQNTRFEQFYKAMEWASGRTAHGTKLVNTQQAAAIYQLSEFSEYRHISLPIIEYYLNESNGDPNNSLFRVALQATWSKLKNGDPNN